MAVMSSLFTEVLESYTRRHSSYLPACPNLQLLQRSSAARAKSKPNGLLLVPWSSSTGPQDKLSLNLEILYCTSWVRVLLLAHCSPSLMSVSDRENAYQFWVLYLPSSGPYASFNTENPVIVKGGYLLRTASSKAGTLEIQGDLDATTSFEVIAPKALSRAVTFNGAPLRVSTTSYGTLTASRSVSLPAIRLPSLQAASWVSEGVFIHSLPER